MKPIIFSTPMVRAILEGRKTMTRRVASKAMPDWKLGHISDRYCDSNGESGCYAVFNVDTTQDFIKGSYKEGDILWVRETWRVSHVTLAGGEESAYIVYKTGEGKSIDIDNKESLFYTTKAKWQSPIFMPRKAARIFLEVVSVRVERLREITPYDACCEGILVELPESMQREQAGLPPIIPEKWKSYSKEKLSETIRNVATSEYMKRLLALKTLVAEYQKLWDSLNAKRGYSWESNPWVWVIEFKRVKEP